MHRSFKTLLSETCCSSALPSNKRIWDHREIRTNQHRIEPENDLLPKPLQQYPTFLPVIRARTKLPLGFYWNRKIKSNWINYPNFESSTPTVKNNRTCNEHVSLHHLYLLYVVRYLHLVPSELLIVLLLMHKIHPHLGCFQQLYGNKTSSEEFNHRQYRTSPQENWLLPSYAFRTPSPNLAVWSNRFACLQEPEHNR